MLPVQGPQGNSSPSCNPDIHLEEVRLICLMSLRRGADHTLLSLPPHHLSCRMCSGLHFSQFIGNRGNRLILICLSPVPATDSKPDRNKHIYLLSLPQIPTEKLILVAKQLITIWNPQLCWDLLKKILFMCLFERERQSKSRGFGGRGTGRSRPPAGRKTPCRAQFWDSGFMA